MNVCRGCGRDFGSVGAFDAHRVGKHEYLWHLDRPDGRRCLDIEELEANWHQDRHGHWRRNTVGGIPPQWFTKASEEGEQP